MERILKILQANSLKKLLVILVHVQRRTTVIAKMDMQLSCKVYWSLRMSRVRSRAIDMITTRTEAA